MISFKILLQRSWALARQAPSIFKRGIVKMLDGMGVIRDWFKSKVVSGMSIDTFTAVANVIPIGGWLKHRELSWAKDNPIVMSAETVKEKERTVSPH